MNNPELIIVHHSAVSRKVAPRQFFAVNRYHRDAKDPRGEYLYNIGPSSLGYYGAYHIFIEPDGTEFRYREDFEVGAHTVGYNDRSLAVCLAGNFDIEMPTDAQIQTLRARLEKWEGLYPSLPICPHRKFANKTCYGSLLSDGWGAFLVQPPLPAFSDAEKQQQILVLQNRLLDLLRTWLLQLRIKVGLTPHQDTQP
jgi:hypothetical protein